MSSIPQARRCNDAHSDTASLAWLSICKQTEKDHDNPSSGCTDRSRSVSGEGADNSRPPPRSGAAKTPEPGRSDQPRYTADSATEILGKFGLDKDDLGELNAYSEDQITPENLKYILMQISINKKRRAAEKSSELQPTIGLKSNLEKAPVKSNKVDCGDFGSATAKKETGKACTDKSSGKSLVETHKPSEDRLQRGVLKGKSRDLDSKTSRKSEISEQNKMVSPKHKPDGPKLCKPLPPKQPESTSKSSKPSKPEQKSSNSKESKTRIEKTTAAGQNKKSPEKKPEVQTEMKRGQQGQDKPVMQTKFKGSSSKNEPSHAVVSPKHKPCKPLPPEQPESTSKSSKPGKAEQKSSNSKESKTQIKETTVAGPNKRPPDKKNPEVQTELKREQDKPVMQTKFKGSSSKNEPLHAVISAKQKHCEPKPCKPLPPKQSESTSKSSKSGKAEQKSSNSKESKAQINETTVAGQNKAELKRGQKEQDKSVMQTRLKGSSGKNKPSDATIRDCKGISPESFPHYCLICNKESHDIQAWCSHMKTTNHREKCQTLYPDLICEQQFSRIDAIWRRCQETGKHKSDFHSPRRRNASHSRSQERRHRRDSISRSPRCRNASRSRSRSKERRHRRNSSFRSSHRRNASRSRSRSQERHHRRDSSSHSPRRRNASRSRSLDRGHRRGSSSRLHSPYRQHRKSRDSSTSTSDSSTSEDRRDRCRSPSRSSYTYRHTLRSRSGSPRYEKSASSLLLDHLLPPGSTSSQGPPLSSSQQREGPSLLGSTLLGPPPLSWDHLLLPGSTCSQVPPVMGPPPVSQDHLLPPGSTSSQGPPLMGPPLMGPPLMGPPLMGPPPVSQDHLLPSGSTSSQVPPLMGPPPVSQDHLLPPGSTSSQGPPLMGPPLMGPPLMGPPLMGPPLMGPPPVSQDHLLPPGSTSSQGPPLMGPPLMGPPLMGPPLMGPPPVSQDHLLPSGSTCSQGPPPSWDHHLPPGSTSSQGPPLMGPPLMGPPLMGPPPVSQHHLLPPGSTSSQGPPPSWDHHLPPGSTCSQGPPLMGPPLMGPPPVSQDHLLPSGSTYSQCPPPSWDHLFPPGSTCSQVPPLMGPPPVSQDHLLPPGSTSSQVPPLMGPPLMGPPPVSQDHLLPPGATCSQGPPPSWYHPFPPGSTSFQGPPLSSFQQRGGPPSLGLPPLSWDHLPRPGSTSAPGHPLLSPGTSSSLPGPPPLPSGISRPSSFSIKEAELFSPGMPSERRLSPKSSSKNPLSPSGSGEKQTSGETSVPQDESSVETLVKKLLQSSAVQSLSKQIDVECVVKTLTPVFLDEFNKLKSTPGSSEAPQAKSTAGFPSNHESSGPQKPPVTSTEQKTATEIKSQPSNKIEALKVKEKPKNETELKCPVITPGESKPVSNKKPAPVISSDDLTVGERIEKCFDPKLLWPVESKGSIIEPELLITNLPKYHDGCYSEDDVVALLHPFGFRNSSDIYVVPQKQLAVAFMPQVKGLRKALAQFGHGMFFRGSKLSLQACRAVTGWKPGKPTSLCLYQALMRCLKHNMTDNGERIICIHHISPSETRDLQTALRKIGSVRNFLPLLNKVFVEFESRQDVDRLGVWHSFLKRGRKHTVERLKIIVASSVALPPKLPAQALPDPSDAVATARIPVANGVIKDCADPPFWVTMSTPPYMFPTMSPWFDIPAFQTVKEVGDIKESLPQASQFSTVMLTGFPQSIRSQSSVAQLVSNYFTKGHSWSVYVLPLQRRAFVFFPCWDSCCTFLQGYLTRKPSPGKDFVLKVHLVLEDMHPGDTEETMYKNLMRWSNAHVSEPESLNQRLICVTFSDVTLSVIRSVLTAVASLAPFVNYLVLAEHVYIEMCDSSSVALVLDLLLFNRLSEEEKKKISDYDEKKKKDIWRKLENVHLFKVKNVRLVQRQPPAGGAVPGLAEGAADKTQPAGVEAAEAAEEEDVGADSAEDRTENKGYTRQPQTPTDKLSKEEGEQIDCVTDQKDELNEEEEEEEKPAEKQKTGGEESEMRGGAAAKDDETSSSEDVLATRVSEDTAAGNSGGDDKREEERTTRDNVLTSEGRAKITESKTSEEETEKRKTADKESEMRDGAAAKDGETSSSEDVTAGGQNEEEEEEEEASTKPEEVGAETLRSADGSDRSSPVLDQSVNAAASCELEETKETKQEVTSTRKRGRPRKKPRKAPVRKFAGGKPESPEENREEEETISLPACKKRRQSPCTVADFILPPFNPDISFGEEFTARKLGYFCSLCSVFYVLQSNEEDTHCCSRNHYDNLLKHSQMKEEKPSSPPKRKTRISR